MKHLAYGSAPILMRIGASTCGDQLNPTPLALTPQLGIVVMSIPQPITCFQGQLLQQPGGHLIVGMIGNGQFCGQWYPPRAHGHGQMQLPPLPPPMPNTVRLKICKVVELFDAIG